MLNTERYSGAIIRLATIQKQKDQPGHLLFASVTLLPHGRPLPPPMDGLDRCNIGKTGETVFFRRVNLNVQEAIEWYRTLSGDGDKSPVPSVCEERNSKYDGIKIEVSNLTDDPAWPYLGLPLGQDIFAHLSGRSHPAPFIGSSPSRIHRRFGSQGGFDLMLSDDKVTSFIARRLHLNLRLYREYLGSVVLIVPDPVLKKIDHFMISSSKERGERIFYRFVPREGVSLSELQLTTFDQQSQLLTDVNTYNIADDGILDLDKGECKGTYGYVVTHPAHGVLAYSPPHPFLRQISFSMHLETQENQNIRVPINESTKSPHMEYPVAKRKSLASQTSIGDAAPSRSVNTRIAIAAQHREKIASAKQYGQRWFPNDSREEAMRFIQGNLRKAKSRVIIADPYLAGLQLGQFLYAVNPDTVSVMILSSTLAFKSDNSKVSKLDYFNKRLVELKRNANVSAKAYVLQSPILHDRFLVIDDTVWFLGNSLNTLGEKASLIVKLPNPDEVIQQLENMMKQSTPFADYKSNKVGYQDSES